MKVTCPTCGRGTTVEADVGDFPTRCQRCGGLLRKPPSPETPAESSGTVRGLSLRRTEPPGRVERGALAGLLSARISVTQAAPAVESSSQITFEPSAATAEASATAVAEPPVTLQPESRREIARVAARQKALRKAQLRGKIQALGALGWMGLVVIGILAISALVLQAHAMWQHPEGTQANMTGFQQ
jgi:hypothetical protein